MAPAVNSRSQWDGELRPSMPPRLRIALGLLAMLPVAAAADWFHWGDWFVFIASILSIIPLAILLSTATEELSLTLGPSIGALLNALFGNATELIIALVALKAGLVDIVKASITGTVMANLLLALGLSMLVGASAVASSASSRWWHGSMVLP